MAFLKNKVIYVNLAAIKFGVSPRPVYAVYDRRICWRRQILAKRRNSPNSPNIIARQNLLIYSININVINNSNNGVCPTLSLIQDLHERLHGKCKIFALTGDSTNDEKDGLAIEIQTSDSMLLITTPEQLQDKKLLGALQRGNCARIIIDEEHCVDEWGYQFRPSYLLLGNVKNDLKCPCVCFTATATNATVQAVIKEVKLNDPFIFKRSFNRLNLYFEVKQKVSKPKMHCIIVDLLSNKYKDQSCIIYCLSPQECFEVCSALIEKGIVSGELGPEEKSSNMKKWQQNEVHVIVATKSLGMGIDKPDVRCVIHASFPATLHEYFQQAGRAGRDGNLSDCILFYRFQDRSLHLHHIYGSDTEIGRRNGLQELRRIVSLCTTKECLKSVLLTHFDEDTPKCIDRCANCKANILSETDVTEHSCNLVLLLQAVIPLIKTASFTTIAKVYRGSKDKETLSKNLNQLPLYGAGKNLTLPAIENILVMLWTKEFIAEDLKSNLKTTFLASTEKSRELLTGQITLVM